MVSEDSDSIGSVLPPIHRCRQLCDGIKPLMSEVITCCHPLYALSKLLEIFPFRSLQRICPEKRDNHFE